MARRRTVAVGDRRSRPTLRLLASKISNSGLPRVVRGQAVDAHRAAGAQRAGIVVAQRWYRRPDRRSCRRRSSRQSSRSGRSTVTATCHHCAAAALVGNGRHEAHRVGAGDGVGVHQELAQAALDGAVADAVVVCVCRRPRVGHHVEAEAEVQPRGVELDSTTRATCSRCPGTGVVRHPVRPP